MTLSKWVLGADVEDGVKPGATSDQAGDYGSKGVSGLMRRVLVAGGEGAVR